MLVGDQPGPEVEARARGDHGVRQVHHLLEVHRLQCAREDEHRQLDARVPAAGHIGQDGVEGGAVQPTSAQLPAHEVEAGRRGGQGGVHRVALRQAEVAEGHLGETDLVCGDEGIATKVEHAGHLARLARRRVRAHYPHTVERTEAQVALADRGFVDHHHVLAQRVDGEMPQAKHDPGCVPRRRRLSSLSGCHDADRA